MSNEAARYFGFACPQEPIDVALMEDIATTHYRRALRTFASRHGELIASAGTRSLIDLYERWFPQADFETVWHVSFGKMREVLAEQQFQATRQDILLSAARLGLRLCERGMTGAWSIPLEAKHRFRFDRVIFPECDRIDVEANSAETTFWLHNDGQKTKFTRATMSKVPGMIEIPQFSTGSRSVGVLIPETPEGTENKEFAFTADEETRRQIISGYGTAIAILKEYCPIYIPFVDRLLRHLVPVKPMPGGYIGGGSLRDNPGTVKLPFEREPVGIAANFGHECAHQHYFLLRGKGRLEDGSDQKLYNCAFVEGARDLPSLVLTYHAFANESIVLRTCEVKGINDPYAGDRAERIRYNLQPIEDILAKSTALTPLGQALFKPAMEHLHAAFK
jgi:hypothetical protein